MAEIYVGTSGWHYDHWRERFYPEAARATEFLSYYAGRFRAVEINNTFYSLPKPETVAAWREDVPERFVFACKASRFITHMKKLKDPEQATRRFFDVVKALDGQLGPILFQLPPRWNVNAERLRSFLDALPGGYRFAFEFRDPSWFCPEVCKPLREHNAAFCIYNMGEMDSPIEVTADFVYVRLHGPAGPYQGSYDDAALAGWARRIRDWRRDGLDVYCFFDNDQNACAPKDALRLMAML